LTEDHDLDIALFGATGFVGKLTAAYLAAHAPKGMRVGIAGRSEQRLESVRAELGPGAKRWRILMADSADPPSLSSLARSTRVLVSTVGPYRQQGLKLVDACVSAGTDYADLTGEVLFMRDSIDRYHVLAARAGTRIVHACGFDSIPSDLGVLLLYQTARADGAGDLEATTLVVTGFRGSASGGTLASLKGQIDEMRANPKVRRIVGDPYVLSPNRAKEADLGNQRELTGISYDEDLGIWLGPFVMAAANTRVVRRSNALQGWAYGRRFQYREVVGFGAGAAAPFKAGAMSTGLAALVAGLAFSPTRALLDRVLPKPGEGPSPRLQRTGFFRIEIHARTSSGARYVAHMKSKGDPGYAATSVMLAESALCLVLDRDRLPDRAGVLTPATAMGTALVDRLRAAGQTLVARRLDRMSQRSAERHAVMAGED
jgi:short subunit dehydrogenase-like uncharacterized protein